MPTSSEVALQHQQQRAALAKTTAAAGAQMWRSINSDDLTGSWLGFLGRLLAILSGAQLLAASKANEYASRALAAQGVDIDPAGMVRPEALSGVASDGRSLDSLLQSPVVATKTAIAQGATTERALATGQANLEMVLRTQVTDAGRVADGVAVTVRPSVGYVRMLVGKTCSRCAVLAGRFYRHNAGFLRHPQCDCVHIPTRGADAARTEGLIEDPREYFDSLSRQEQNRIFTNAGAEAIRDGADIGQIVNARRGAAGLSKAGGRLTREEQRVLRGGRDQGQLQRTDVFGRGVFTTTEGTTRRGFAGQRLLEQGARTEDEQGEVVTRRSRTGDVQRTVQRKRVQTPRLMPESIYEFASSREEAIRLLRRFGYIA